jgi:hypothetical protein
MEVDEVPDEGDAVPFPGEDTIMMIYNGRPSPGLRCMSNLSPGTIAHCGWWRRDTGMWGHTFSLIFVH